MTRRLRRTWTAAGLAALGVALAPAPAPAADGPLDGGVTRDPWEGFNRKIFWFNEQLDRFVLEPVATGWDRVLPDRVQISLRDVSNHIALPVVFLNDVLQLKPAAAAEDVGRFAINTLWGVAGIWDAAALVDLEANDEDFGQTLGYWGVPPGPYLVLPVLGPSSPRDAVGLAVDSGPRGALTSTLGIPFYITASITAVDMVNRRSLLLEEIREEREAAFDFYVAVRNAWIQNRQRRVEDGEDAPAEPKRDDDLYYLDEEDDAD